MGGKKPSKRAKFMATVKGPYVCFFCKKPVTVLTDTSGDSLVGHHKNGNHDDDRKSNWVAAHNNCHTRHHCKGKKQSPEHVAARAAAMVGNTNGKYGRAGRPK